METTFAENSQNGDRRHDDMTDGVPTSPIVAPKLSRFGLALALLVLGYVLFDRAFAWLHIPGTPVFLGEIVLAAGLFVMASGTFRPSSFLSRSWPLIALTAFMGWGAILLVSGVGGFGVNAMRDATLWYYGLFALLVALSLAVRPLDWWVDRYADILPYLVLWMPIALALDALVTDANLLVPDSSVSVFSHFSYNVATHAGMALAFLWAAAGGNERLRRMRTPLSAGAIITIVTAGMVSRSSLLAAGVGGLILLAAIRRSRIRLVFFGSTLLVLVIGMGLVFDVEVALFRDRTDRPVSAQQLADNVLSIVNPDQADESLSGTSEWRTGFWQRVIHDVTHDRPIVGYGFGTNIREMYGEQDEDPPARNPHSSHVNVLARMGWFGMLLWVVLWVSWFAALASAKRRFVRAGLGDAAGVAVVLMVGVAMYLTNGIFNEVTEGPHSAIPLWTMFGAGAYLAMSRPRPRPTPYIRLVRSDT